MRGVFANRLWTAETPTLAAQGSRLSCDLKPGVTRGARLQIGNTQHLGHSLRCLRSFRCCSGERRKHVTCVDQPDVIGQPRPATVERGGAEPTLRFLWRFSRGWWRLSLEIVNHLAEFAAPDGPRGGFALSQYEDVAAWRLADGIPFGRTCRPASHRRRKGGFRQRKLWNSCSAELFPGLAAELRPDGGERLPAMGCGGCLQCSAV